MDKEPSGQQEHHDVNDSSYWTRPPPNPSAPGQPIWVDCRFVLAKVSKVDTVAASTYVDIHVVFYWTDPRLAGWPEEAELPPRLWGPRLQLTNAQGGLEEKDNNFALDDPTTGRLKRARYYTGTIDNPMSLHDFPFDIDVIESHFKSSSGWSTLDGERGGAAPKGRSYRLRRVQEPGEGKWLALLWDGKIEEWESHGVSIKLEEEESGHGSQRTTVKLSVHVTRKSAYYFWKALLPLYLLTALSMGTFHFETDNLADRYATVSTYFLAAFAMLYVVGASLPKTSFLTTIDIIIILSTLSLAFIGMASLLVGKLHTDAGEDVAGWWNLVIEVSLISLYVLANLAIFIPPLIKKVSARRKLSGYKRSPDTEMLLPTVHSGCDYYTLEDIKHGLKDKNRGPG